MSRKLKYQSAQGVVAYQADIVIAVKGATQLTNLQKQIEATSASINKVNKQLASQGLLGNSISNLQKTVAASSQAMRSATTGTAAQKQAIDVYVKSLAQAEQAELALTKAIKVRQRELGIATTKTAQASGGKMGGRVSGAVGNALIGGAFPLLFGQGGGAAFGGAVGGLVGGAFGGVGGFAGSLVGTLLGDIASRGQAVKQLADDIGFSAEQTKQLSDAFKVANTDVEKFTAVIQNIRGVGLEIEDQAKAIQLVTRLTELYGGSFEKTGNAITSALESGKVTQATLNQLTSQGITVQDALAKKYGVSRDAILKMAKDGDITVQALINTLVQLGNEGENAAKKPKTAFEQFTAALGNTGTAVANLATQIGKTLGPALDAILLKATAVLNALNQAFAAGSISVQQKQAAKGRAEQIVQSQAGFLPGGPFGAGAVNVKYGQKTYTGSASSVVSQLTNDLINAEVQRAVGKTPAAPVKLSTFAAPSQAAPSGSAGAKGPKPPEDMTAKLKEDLDAMKLISVTQDGIRDALFEGNRELAIRLEYDQKVADINRDTAKALLNANYESEKAVINAQEIVRLKDAELERDDQLRELARDINEIIANTLDDLRGGITWDDTGMREIFDMRLPDAIKETEDNLRDLTSPSTQIIAAATAISDAFSDTFRGIVSGSMTAKEALSNFFKGIGDAFTSMAAQIIAEAIKLQAIKFISSLIGSAVGSFASSTLTAPGLEGAGALVPGISTGAAVPSYGAGVVQPLSVSPQITPGGAFAEGGFVTGPTNALIGEAGESEYVIPASKMSSAMARYSAGARGESVLSGNAPAQRATQALDINYNVTDINGMRFVTEEQFTRGMRDAAKMGQAMTFSTLRSSPSVRRKLGV